MNFEFTALDVALGHTLRGLQLPLNFTVQNETFRGWNTLPNVHLSLLTFYQNLSFDLKICDFRRSDSTSVFEYIYREVKPLGLFQVQNVFGASFIKSFDFGKIVKKFVNENKTNTVSNY